MFILTSTPLEQINLREGFSSTAAGALCIFEGRVRDRNEGRQVVALEYEVYPELCRREARVILGEANASFPIIEVRIYHRAGLLKPGETAVWIGVTCAHRDDSFKACRFLIDAIKHRLPIWKKEYYTDGESAWIAYDACASHKAEARAHG